MTNPTSGCPYFFDVLSSMDGLALSTPEGSLVDERRNPREADVESESSGAAVPTRPRPQVVRKRRARAMTLVDRDRPRKRKRTYDGHDHQTQSTSHQQDLHQHQHRPLMVPRRGTGPAEAARALDRGIDGTHDAHAQNPDDERNKEDYHGEADDEGEEQERFCPHGRIQRRVNSEEDEPNVPTSNRSIQTGWRVPLWRRRAASAGRALTGWPRCQNDSLRRPRLRNLEAQTLVASSPAIPLPATTLQLGFSRINGMTDIPAAFYAGTGIPTLLRLSVDWNSTIPYDLRPQLHLTLTGTLRLAYGERHIIQVSVSLADGLSLWSQDAISTLRACPSPLLPGQADPQKCLPGGSYNLPLTVQIPVNRLPPSFETPDGRFSISYRFTATLSIENPRKRHERMLLGLSHAPFTLLPTTLPDNPLTLHRVSTLEWHRCGLEWEGKVLTDCSDVREEWAFEPTLPCTTFSPTQVVPIELLLTPVRVESAKARMFIRVGIKRYQHVTLQDSDPKDPVNELHENLVSGARIGIFEISGQEPTRISGTCLPLAIDGNWPFGYSTYSGEVPQPGPFRSVAAGNQFYVFVQIGRLPDAGPLAEPLPVDLPLNRLLPLDAARFRDLNRHATQLSHCMLPITIGSVSEPLGAMHYIPWSDLSLSEGPRLIEGGAFSAENGWLVPPPPYLAQPPYIPQPNQLVVTTLAETTRHDDMKSEEGQEEAEAEDEDEDEDEDQDQEEGEDLDQLEEAEIQNAHLSCHL